MRYLFAAVIAVFVIAVDFESSNITSIWMEPSFVAEAQSEPVATSNSRIAHDGLLSPPLFELRWTGRFARNDDPETGIVIASAEYSQGSDATNVAAAPDEKATAADAAAHAAASIYDESASADPICETVKTAAEENDLPIGFLVRLLWQESRFHAAEISSAGARGIAQFMPQTAVEMGLRDPFDPLQALPASARFLRKLHDEFGNLGLAAAAYNAGSGRIQKWLSGRSALPRETRDYVRIITGNNAENWLEESKTLSLHLELPRDAPCEGVGGLSKAKEVAAIPVALAPSISDAIKKAETEAQRANAAKLEAAAKAKTRFAQLAKKKSLKELASSRAVRKLATLQSAAGRPRRSVHTALAKRLVHSRTKAAQRSRQVDET